MGHSAVPDRSRECIPDLGCTSSEIRDGHIRRVQQVGSLRPAQHLSQPLRVGQRSDRDLGAHRFPPFTLSHIAHDRPHLMTSLQELLCNDGSGVSCDSCNDIHRSAPFVGFVNREPHLMSSFRLRASLLISRPTPRVSAITAPGDLALSRTESERNLIG